METGPKGAPDLLDRGSIRHQSLDALGAIHTGDFPACWSLFQIHRLGFVAILIDILDTHFDFAVGERLRLRNGDPFSC